MNLKYNIRKMKSPQMLAWALLVIALSALLLHGLSIFVAKPKIETVTVNPSNTSSNSYMNQTQDVDFKHQSARKH